MYRHVLEPVPGKNCCVLKCGAAKSSVPRGQLGLRCDLGGGRRRTLRNQHSDCPFHLYARRLRSGKWEINVQNATHSHEAAPLALHPVACRLSSGQRLAEIGEEQEALKAEMQYNDIGASCGFPWRVVAIRKRVRSSEFARNFTQQLERLMETCNKQDKSGNGDAQEDTRDQLNNLQGNKQLQTHSFAAT
ncbi:hypothetical protein PC129_g9271 [Phytophthora cactorum]|uniref:FAR1 domain-containing protein n=1 Tax=Phytophthora cactorum TaxID=29920 RepID=A0A8T1I788_9STRA|nr:hypothetical protein PC129_g9271 [Phytophthora cactorum]